MYRPPPAYTSETPKPTAWKADEVALVTYCQQYLPTLDADRAVRLAEAVERHAPNQSAENAALARQVCMILREGTDLVSQRSGPNTAKLRHVAICRALASAARLTPLDDLRAELTTTLLALRYTPHLAWHEPNSTLGWLACWATSSSLLDPAPRMDYAVRGFPLTAPALRAWYGPRSLEPRYAHRLGMTLLQRLDQPAVDPQLVLWLGSALSGELRVEWLTAWRRRVAGDALLTAEVRKRGLTRALRTLCEHDPLPTRYALALLLGDLGHHADEDYLLSLLPECKPAQQAELAQRLEWIGTRAALPALSALISSNPLVRRPQSAAAKSAIARIVARYPADQSRAGGLSLATDTGPQGGLSLAQGAHEHGALSLARTAPAQQAYAAQETSSPLARLTRWLRASLLGRA
jgi:hypothetical protein